ncbi:Chemotaxis protein methyltransferase CheR [hydrothermal vent metagenome]|uniref:Chemotaxis protein methyltransferase CheR n=1 Tax=hydrothermal vent metagenome TaxID=652676 RepID=A0A3B0VU13_9ZZZZ
MTNDTDIASRAAVLAEELQDRDKLLKDLLTFSHKLLLTSDKKKLYRICDQTAKDLLHLDFSTLLLLGDNDNSLVIRHTIGFPPTMVDSYILEEGQGLSTIVLKEKRMITVIDHETEQRFTVPPIVFKKKITSAICAPMMLGDEVLGVLIGHTLQRHVFNETEQIIYQSLANQSAVAIKNTTSYSALKEKETLLSTIIDTVRNPIFCKDNKGGCLACNSAFADFVGCSCDEIINCGTKNAAQLKLAEVYEESDQSLWERGGRQQYETKVEHADGSIRDVLLCKASFCNDSGEVAGIVGTIMDITEQKQEAEEKEQILLQMQHVQKLESLGVLAGGIAHDFNNLLMAILGNADLALAEISPFSAARHNLEAIESASRRAADLCRQMLAYSGKGKFVIQQLNCNELVEEMTHMLEISISKKAVMKFNLADKVPPIEADATQIRQIIMNLVINASDAINDKSGIISITTGAMECDRDYLTETYIDEQLPEGIYSYIEVADTGCGMDEETKAKMFDPFFTTKFTGRGLGMAAVLGIVRGHNGALKIYSEPSRGTTIKLIFPIAANQDVKEKNEGRQDKNWQGKGLILLVDDEETIRAVGRQMLEYLGFSVITAADGQEATKTFKARAAEINLVLMDLTMPHMDGEEAYREMRRIDSTVQVIMASGYNEQEVTQRFVGKGLAGFIQKPFMIDDLRDILRQSMIT